MGARTLELTGVIEVRRAQGRPCATPGSALDAVEVMDVATNYIREHIEPPARIHYVIPNGGKQPNVVPDESSVWHYFRQTDAQKTWDLFKRASQVVEAMRVGTSETVNPMNMGAADLASNRSTILTLPTTRGTWR
jgi:metal-dependent amidase/aminoacylase/carboxypeptidase family protein